MFEDEMWKDIAGYENKYYISNYGRLKNNNKIIKPMVATNGYLIACLWKNNKQKKLVIHRLVANLFIPNPNNYNEVNHIDEDKTNNKADNLEWCSHKYNMNYGKIKEKISKANKGKIPDEKTRYKLSINSKDRIWINSGLDERFIKKDDLSKFYNWKLGRAFKKGGNI